MDPLPAKLDTGLDPKSLSIPCTNKIGIIPHKILPPAAASGGSTSTSNSESARAPAAPYFFPPLWLARRTKIVKILREQQVGSVVDLGCGDGAVLQILSVPANHLDDFPTLYPPSPGSSSPLLSNSGSHSSSNSEAELEKSAQSSKERKRCLLNTIPRTDRELHLRRLVGVDVDLESLGRAAEITRPARAGERNEHEPTEDELAEAKEGKYHVERERWEELRIELYQGAVETYSESLASGIEAMFATEVIEHMSTNSLRKFMPMVLGVYSPRLFIITTPNHEFNPYFLSKSNSDESSNRFSDPTQRTSRIFRDDDHQFEWTQLEFENWAKEIAFEHEYSVEFTGVGSLAHYYGHGNPIRFPPPSLSSHPALVDLPSAKELPQDPSKFYATQIAIFTRHYSKQVERSPRSHRTTPLPFFSPLSSPVSSPLLEKNTSLPVPVSNSSLTSTISNPASPSSPTSAPPMAPASSSLLLPTLTKSPTLVKSLSSTPHVLLKTHLHPAHPTATNPLPPSEILNLLADLAQNDFRKKVVSLREYWNKSEVRRAAGGAIGNVVEAVLCEETNFKVDSEGLNLDSEPEEEEWDFVLLQSDQGGYELKGDEALGIVWKGFVEREREEEVDRREGDGDEEDEEDQEEEEVWNGQAQGEVLSDKEEDDKWGRHIRSEIATTGSTW